MYVTEASVVYCLIFSTSHLIFALGKIMDFQSPPSSHVHCHVKTILFQNILWSYSLSSYHQMVLVATFCNFLNIRSLPVIYLACNTANHYILLIVTGLNGKPTAILYLFLRLKSYCAVKLLWPSVHIICGKIFQFFLYLSSTIFSLSWCVPCLFLGAVLEDFFRINQSIWYTFPTRPCLLHLVYTVRSFFKSSFSRQCLLPACSSDHLLICKSPYCDVIGDYMWVLSKQGWIY